MRPAAEIGVTVSVGVPARQAGTLGPPPPQAQARANKNPASPANANARTRNNTVDASRFAICWKSSVTSFPVSTLGTAGVAISRSVQP